MARQGLNCTLSYMNGKTRNAYQVRANMVSHGMQVIYDESQARVRQAFYPHRLSSAKFGVQVQLVGEAEYVSFTNWLASYAEVILSPDMSAGAFQPMTVSVPSYDFLRKGVPLTGYEWGDAVGKMLWEIMVVFETSSEAGDQTLPLSQIAVGPALYGRDTRFFYPTGTQMSGDEKPPNGTYTRPIYLSDIIAAPAPLGNQGLKNRQRNL